MSPLLTQATVSSMPLTALPGAGSLTWESAREWFVGDPLRIAAVIVIAVLARWLLQRLIRRVVATATSKHAERVASTRGARVLAEVSGAWGDRHVQRTRTVGAVLGSVVTIVITTIAILTIMSMLGLPLGPLLASAGVGGVALGFGAQSLVKDFLSGIFMIIEDQYGVGDVIDTGEVTGTVENVSLRVTQLRDGNGVTWYVRNGEILRIGNTSQGWSLATVDVPIAGTADVSRAIEVMRSVVEQLSQEQEWADQLLEPPQVVGVESITASGITLRTLAKTVAGQQYGVQRELRERVKIAFDRAGIAGPTVLLPPSTAKTSGPTSGS